MSDQSQGNGNWRQDGARGGAWRDSTWRSPGGFEARPHAYDPTTQPELFRGVLLRRVFAFLIDVVVLAIPVLLAYIFVAVFGLITLGLGWALFWLVWPASVIWALVYYGSTLGGPHSATVGMRAMDLQLRTWYGEPGYFVLGAVHAVLFWVSISVLSPLVLVVGLFNGRRRLLHDIVLGTVIINRSSYGAVTRPMRTV
ncbi:MAG: RDD family protein [Pseudomonadota bacterium]